MSDGIHAVELTIPVEKVKGMFPEFFGNVTVNGQIQKLGSRYTFTGTAQCLARLICDRSLEEFEELISAPLTVSFLANTELIKAAEGTSSKDETVKLVREDQKELNITDEVIEELAVNIPMRRIAPEFRDKDLSELYPNIAAKDATDPSDDSLKEDEIDERWAALKKLKNKN